MTDEVKIAAEEQTKQTENTDTVAPQTEAPKADAVKEEAKVEEKVGDIVNPQEKKPEPKMVPEAALIEYKKANKELKKGLDELKQLIESGGTKQEVSADLKAIAEEHDVDPEFLRKFAAAIKAEAETELEEKFSSKIKPMEEKEKAKEVESKISGAFQRALEANPEYKDIVTKEAFRSLVTDPRNSDKTLTKILEENYGHLVTGRRTIDTTIPGGGKGDAEIDYERAKKDTAYFSEIMADPAMKKKYNENLEKRLSL